MERNGAKINQRWSKESKKIERNKIWECKKIKMKLVKGEGWKQKYWAQISNIKTQNDWIFIY